MDKNEWKLSNNFLVQINKKLALDATTDLGNWLNGKLVLHLG
jgi:hypothetical protein